MALMIYNTLTRRKEEFVPIEPGMVKLYVCGMTVYDYCHLGHARVMIAFDVVVRYLRSQGYAVKYVRNITDVDDKILKRAAERGVSFKKITNKFIRELQVDSGRLNLKPPTKAPRATEYIQQIVEMIGKLISKEYAYRAANGDVYYAVSKFDGYGKLSGMNSEELLAGARVDIDDAKRDPRDFALWKAAKPTEEAVWDSPWGAGRPGWHIECSAMSTCCLGDTFDIHGGGPDLRFPHHENEIAQSEAATGQRYVNYWMHAGAVRVDGEKMSKSLGNFFTIREILEQLDQIHVGVGAEIIRFLFLTTHYRSPIDYSQNSLQDAVETLRRFSYALQPFDDVQPADFSSLAGDEYYERFVMAMDDDFNTPSALAVMLDLVSAINSCKDARDSQKLVSVLRALGQVLGILPPKSANVVLKGFSVKAFQGGVWATMGENTIDTLIAERTEAKKSKSFARADEIRKQLLAEGVVLEDRKDGTTDWRRE